MNRESDTLRQVASFAGDARAINLLLERRSSICTAELFATLHPTIDQDRLCLRVKSRCIQGRFRCHELMVRAQGNVSVAKNRFMEPRISNGALSHHARRRPSTVANAFDLPADGILEM